METEPSPQSSNLQSSLFLLLDDARLHRSTYTSTTQTARFLKACDASNSLAG